MITRTLTLLALTLCAGTAAADDPPKPLTVELVEKGANLLVNCATKLPHGTQLSCALVFGGKPLSWRRAYALRGKASFVHRKGRFLPGEYQALVRYELRDQPKRITKLIKALKPFPAKLEATATLRLGDAATEARGRVTELALMVETLKAVETHLEGLAPLAKEAAKAFKANKYDAPAAIRGYLAWFAELARAAKPVIARQQTYDGAYEADLFDRVVNVVDKAQARARAQAFQELTKAKARIPAQIGVPGEFMRDPKLLIHFLDEELPKLRKDIEAREKVRKKALEGIKSGD